MANKIHAIKFLNWLFLRIKPSDYDPTQPLEFEGGIGGGASLPDQTGNAGKFLQTNGSEASWGEAVVNQNSGKSGSVIIASGDTTSPKNYGANNVSIGSGSIDSRNYSVHIGYSSYDRGTDGGAVGIGAYTSTYGFGIAIGFYAKTGTNNAIQLSCDTKEAKNSDANTFKVANTNGNFEMMDANGNVPLERLTYVTTNISQMGDQVQGIEERIPGHASTTNLLATMTDAGKHLKSPTDTDASFCLQFGDLVMCGGTVAFNNLGAGIAAEMPADLPVAMAGDYIVVCTPTADSNFDHLIADYGSRTSNAFTISCDNMGDAQATNIKVSWIAIGKKGA